MGGDPISTVIGVLPDNTCAEKAIDDLRRNGFSYNRIRLVQRGNGSVFDNLKGMFTGQASVVSNTVDDLTKMGMPDYEAHHYQQELEANRILLLMNADDRPEEAFRLLRQNGAFDINARLRTTAPDTSTQAARAEEERELTPADRRTTTARTDVPPAVSQRDTVAEEEAARSKEPPAVSQRDTVAEEEAETENPAPVTNEEVRTEVQHNA